jgi:hypothetical protein
VSSGYQEHRAAAIEYVARAFHETYEKSAPAHNYPTRPESAVPWDQVPERNKALMREVVSELEALQVIEFGPLTRRVIATTMVEQTDLEKRLGRAARET